MSKNDRDKYNTRHGEYIVFDSHFVETDQKDKEILSKSQTIIVNIPESVSKEHSQKKRNTKTQEKPEHQLSNDNSIRVPDVNVSTSSKNRQPARKYDPTWDTLRIYIHILHIIILFVKKKKKVNVSLEKPTPKQK
ncbi:hypothetical protein RFI_21275 [Reticulomyxa filosa]|uniref:Uncharacterized protein n=1 Tax=Reticulomyxa filosa TaxID=46433 RepID=X6MSK0_RETFI|nr:hypothetical protein RFI_21275 [Reticulomyxa filosa]|eukprot:ETO16085.1 hypothetical protein RFI_21275 [Reticulomyxa filosa]